MEAAILRRKARGPAAPGEGPFVPGAVELAQRGDMVGLHFLYARYADDVLGYVKTIVPDHHQAEDITQDVFAKLMRAIRSYEPRDVPFSAWILRVARNAALDYLRSRRALPCEEVRELEPGVRSSDASDAGDAERSRSIRQALDRLPEEQREVLILRHITGLSPREIASVLDRTEGSIHGLHHRGRLTLQDALRELGSAPVTASAA